MENESVSLYGFAAALAKECCSLYRDIRPCKDDLLGFMDANGWFGQKAIGSGDKIRIERPEDIKERLLIWLRAYRRSAKEKTDILFEVSRDRYPKTCELYRDFLTENGLYGQDGSLRVLDYLLSAIDREIILYTEDETQRIIQEADAFLAIANVNLLFRFLEGLRRDGLSLAYRYETKSRRIAARDNSAYALDEFARMAYWTFHPDSWKERQLVEKAAASGKFAELWLFIALHFVCAWRKSDMLRPPLPELPYAPDETRRKILAGEFQDGEARELVREWLFLLELLDMKPEKTAAYGGVPSLKLFIPETLEQPFGVILALAASHKNGDGRRNAPCCDRRTLEMFFGKEFAEIAGRKGFLNRRANKALLQGIENSADAAPGKPMGYMLAALARSHKGGIAELSSITDIYLKDANFTGYKPEFILREMFERGIFGFIPAMLLESYAGEQYRKLSVSSQTQLIRHIGLSPLEIENIVSFVGRSLRRAERNVRETVASLGNSREAISALLQKISVGAVPAKQPDMICLRMAAGMTCPYADRSCCVGCGYEIPTKATLQILMRDYVSLSWRRAHADGWQKERCRRLLEEAVLSPVTEIMASVPVLYPDADMAPLLEIMERGLNHATALNG